MYPKPFHGSPSTHTMSYVNCIPIKLGGAGNKPQKEEQMTALGCQDVNCNPHWENVFKINTEEEENLDGTLQKLNETQKKTITEKMRDINGEGFKLLSKGIYCWNRFFFLSMILWHTLSNNGLTFNPVTQVSLKWKASPGWCAAQWTERWPANQRVTISIPSRGTCLGCGPGPQ